MENISSKGYDAAVKKLQLALFGHGKMGRLVERLARDAGHTLVPLSACEVCIDFSHRDAVLKHVSQAAALKKAVVMGTTGWERDFAKVKEIVANEKIGFLYSPNFSTGVYLFLQIVKEAAKLLDPFEEYAVEGLEMHHSEKVDSPSGTAREIAKTIALQMRKKEKMHFESVRMGDNPGMHAVLFDSPSDTLRLAHQAKNREGFARGAIRAAEWLYGKQGFFTMEDLCLKGC